MYGSGRGRGGTGHGHQRGSSASGSISIAQRRAAELSSAYANLAIELTKKEIKTIGGYSLGRVIGQGQSRSRSPLRAGCSSAAPTETSHG